MTNIRWKWSLQNTRDLWFNKFWSQKSQANEQKVHSFCDCTRLQNKIDFLKNQYDAQLKSRSQHKALAYTYHVLSVY